jgi:hypothetical protein
MAHLAAVWVDVAGAKETSLLHLRGSWVLGRFCTGPTSKSIQITKAKIHHLAS